MHLDLGSRYWPQLDKPLDFAIRSGRPAVSTVCIAVADDSWPIEGRSFDGMDSIQSQHKLAIAHRVVAAIERRLMAVQIGPLDERIEDRLSAGLACTMIDECSSSPDKCQRLDFG